MIHFYYNIKNEYLVCKRAATVFQALTKPLNKVEGKTFCVHCWDKLHVKTRK